MIWIIFFSIIGYLAMAGVSAVIIETIFDYRGIYYESKETVSAGFVWPIVILGVIMLYFYWLTRTSVTFFTSFFRKIRGEK